MTRYSLYIQEDENRVNRRAGKAKIDRPKPGQVFRLGVKQARLTDLQVLSVDEDNQRIIFEEIPRTTQFLHLLEQLVYKLNTASRLNVPLPCEAARAAKALIRVCGRGGNRAECEHIKQLLTEVQKKIEEK